MAEQQPEHKGKIQFPSQHHKGQGSHHKRLGNGTEDQQILARKTVNNPAAGKEEQKGRDNLHQPDNGKIHRIARMLVNMPANCHRQRRSDKIDQRAAPKEGKKMCWHGLLKNDGDAAS